MEVGCSVQPTMWTAHTQFNENEHVNGFQPQCFDGEKVTCQHLMLVMSQEGAPCALRLPQRRRWKTMPLEQITNGRAVNGVAEFDQFPCRMKTLPLAHSGFLHGTR